MAVSETLDVPQGASRDEIYRALLPQIESVVAGVDDLIANLANIAAILKTAFDFHWVGFYRTTSPGMLTLGPFQGPLACVSIPFDKGVCGAAASGRETVVVGDVDAFPGHIACSSLSRSEIVVPLVHRGTHEQATTLKKKKNSAPRAARGPAGDPGSRCTLGPGPARC